MSGLRVLDRQHIDDIVAIKGYRTQWPWCQPNTYWARSDDALLYVGACTDLRVRLRSHKWNSVWWPQVTRMDVQFQPSKHEALRVERHSINTDRPVYNVHRRRSTKPRPSFVALRSAIAAELGEDPVSFSLRYRAVGHSWQSVAFYLEQQLPAELHRTSMWQILSQWVYAAEEAQ